MGRYRMIFVYIIIQGVLMYQNFSVFAKRRYKLEPRIILHELKNCPGHNGPNQYINDSLIVAGKGIILANADIVIKEPAVSLSGIITVVKCTSSLLSSCEHFLKLTLPDFCEGIVKKGQFWTPLYDSITPRFKCPVSKGIYRLRNASVDVNSILKYRSMIPFMDNYVWRFEIMMIREPEKNEFFCYVGSGEYKNIKMKQK